MLCDLLCVVYPESQHTRFRLLLCVYLCPMFSVCHGQVSACSPEFIFGHVLLCPQENIKKYLSILVFMPISIIE